MRPRMPKTSFMRHGLTGRLLPLLAIGTVASVLPALVELEWGGDRVAFTGTLHFYAVGMSALVAPAAAARPHGRSARAATTRAPSSSARRSP